MVTERRRTGVNRSHRSTSPQDYGHPEVQNCVTSCGNDNRHTMVISGIKGAQKESKVAERKRDKKGTDSSQPRSPGHFVQGRLDPAGT